MRTIIIIALATYYLQHVLRWERGPFGVFDAVRGRVMGVHIVSRDGDYRQEATRQGELSELAMCIYCASFWVALAMSAIVYFVWEPALWPFAAAGGCVLVDSIVRANYGIGE